MKHASEPKTWQGDKVPVSDRGSQFRSRKTQRALTHHGMIGSMGQVGSAADNAAMESFFLLLQRSILDRRRWATRAELRIAIVTWIERIYHRRRRQAALGRLTPIEYDHDPHRHSGGITQLSPTRAAAPSSVERHEQFVPA
jgi:transposase InsO family protein